MSHPRTPRSARWLIGAGLGYLVSPIDLIPDFIPIIGQLDDVLVLGLCIGIAMIIIPADVKVATRVRTRSVACKTTHQQSIDLDHRTSFNFETAPLPSEFGVRVMYVNPDHTLDPDAILQLESLIIEHHLIVTDEKLFAALNPQAPQLCSLFIRHNQMPNLACGPALVDLMMAYSGLSEEDQRNIDGFTVTDSTPGIRGCVARSPLVCRHPKTQEKFLHPCLPRLRICDLNASESNAWIDKLTIHTEQPGFLIQLKDRPNQVVAWDAIAVQPLARAYLSGKQPTARQPHMAGSQDPY